METARLTIRRFTPDDRHDLFEYLSQASVVKFEPYEAFTEEEAAAEAVRRMKNANFWAVCIKNSGKLIGNIYLEPQAFDTWELGFAFNEKYWGNGFAAEASRVLMDDVFRNQQARRIKADCNPLNESSWKLLERLNFRREGHLRKNVYFKKDEHGAPIWTDTYMYAILQEEWKNQP
jgi:RimJ/RimL family protein N-acetyltransferase